ncbi:exodeoxyribonuclease VII small subunit [Pacificibacter marinus]|jgi:exodeoxyribonuclease VII small subunit|uniref:Exodeoxyribonuclease 7 small subunit n=1 Tax=Pacificibacter marinus TaxID=658057 RepID=A0A1Y5TCB6_9RHOB|nr:exodeoxyribonuclease VII small subunit [Pacificibacter marinus]SEL12375.1 Exodeoxyribonuclease VII small subunit [Pacificibacter marinus]SLN60831.1 Exodeoxyribonuclease 7 small subunit [Pacificibacter marinus]
MTETPVSEMSFEAAMAELDQVVAKLEHGEVALEDSIKLYERGATLKAHCEAKLKDATEKVEKISVGSDGKPASAQPVEGL